MDVQEDLLIFILKRVLKEGETQLELLNRSLSIPSKPFRRLTFTEAKTKAQELGVESDPHEDFGAPEETALSEAFQEPFFIIEFPTHLRGIYYATYTQKPSITRSLDLMAPEGFGELSSGGQRVSDYESLKKRIIEGGFDIDDFQWYLRMFKYGMPPHAGFGLGFERLVRWIAKTTHIRETCMFPRTPDIFQP